RSLAAAAQRRGPLNVEQPRSRGRARHPQYRRGCLCQPAGAPLGGASCDHRPRTRGPFSLPAPGRPTWDPRVRHAHKPYTLSPAGGGPIMSKLIAPIILLFGLVILWAAACQVFEVSPFLLPTPMAVAQAAADR